MIYLSMPARSTTSQTVRTAQGDPTPQLPITSEGGEEQRHVPIIDEALAILAQVHRRGGRIRLSEGKRLRQILQDTGTSIETLSSVAKRLAKRPEDGVK